MLTTAFISMWITNTATTAMMTPIMEAVLKQLDKQFVKENPTATGDKETEDVDGSEANNRKKEEADAMTSNLREALLKEQRILTLSFIY